MVRLDGFGKIDDRETRTNNNDRKQVPQTDKDRGRQGFLLNDLQFEHLRGALNLPRTSPHSAQLRADLNAIREFVLKSSLQDAEKPTRPEIHKALAEVARRLRLFLDRIDSLDPLPEWPLADPAAVEGPSPFRVFMTLPWRLRACAENGAIRGKNKQGPPGPCRRRQGRRICSCI
jgi:hypothetical protein